MDSPPHRIAGARRLVEYQCYLLHHALLFSVVACIETSITLPLFTLVITFFTGTSASNLDLLSLPKNNTTLSLFIGTLLFLGLYWRQRLNLAHVRKSSGNRWKGM